MALIISLSGYAQNVGITDTSNPPDPAAGLDINFASKGLLIPRVALTGTANFAPLPAHVAGMIVYNTANPPLGDVKPGFYYNDGTKWIAGFPVGNAIGDMLYWTGTAWSLLPVGTVGQYLTLNASNIPYWATAAGTANIVSTAASAITGISATSGGNIISDGGLAVLSRGVCWNTSTGPTIANSKTIDGAGIGIFSSSLTGLTPVTTYYVRAYAMNSSSITYGNEISFTTTAVLPTLAATTAAGMTGATAIGGGNVTNTGGVNITERGICYGTSLNPIILLNTKIINLPNPPTPPGSGAFTCNITGLTGSTTYHARSYAINSVGTAYGNDIAFTTLVVPPTLVTVAATNISGASAASGGSMNWNGGGYSNYQNYGVCYSTTPVTTLPVYIETSSPNYSRIATNTANGSVNPAVNISPWVTNLTGLAANTTYYIRSYLNLYGSAGWITVYGPELSLTTTAPSAPIVTSTTAITGISDRTGNSGGAITTDGGSAITAKGVCWSTSPSPTLGVGNFTSNGTGTASFVSNITGLTGSTTYYVRAYATNAIGTSYSTTDQTFTTCVASPYKVGDFAGGGRVFYVSCDGHGLIAALSDQSTNAVWGCSGTNIVTSSTVGTGAANTAAILAGCADRPIAASIASSCTDGGYNDWYLPSQAELGLLVNSGYLFGVQVSYYPSSTQSNATTVSGYYYANNWQASGLAKTTQFKVRAIRSF